jgi:peptide/nickel transport system permease protein
MNLRTIWRRLRRRPLALLGVTCIGVLGATAILAEFIASDLPIATRYQGRLYILPNLRRPAALVAEDNQSLRAKRGPGDWLIAPPVPYGPYQIPALLGTLPAAPDATHWLGTDANGRDVLARLVHGARVSLAVGFVAVALYVAIGVVLGGAAGYFRGRVDLAISRLIEIVLTFPTLFLILAVMGMLERTSILGVMVVLGLTGWTGVARLVRAETMKLADQDFVVAARAQGLHPARIIFRHLLPGALGPVLVSATFGVASAVIIEASLSFLGFGAPPPTASWGELLNEAEEHGMKWWLTLYPGLAIFLTTVSYNLVGEALRDAIDPRLEV